MAERAIIILDVRRQGKRATPVSLSEAEGGARRAVDIAFQIELNRDALEKFQVD